MTVGRFKYSENVAPPPGMMHEKIFVACRVAARYPSRVPTCNELIDDFGMSRPTAYRWISAIKAARGLDGVAA